MSYVALYRKYRPDNFEGIIGQENITKILKNQIKSNKISHAYIFSGSRGTGKTSAAKVFSRAINCLSPKDGEPCNECEVCKNIISGNTTDVVEMDAASNNSVENIRQIRQEVVYATIDVKYRVYIIDEAHMLTTSAFNALLKTLEEPPANVVFILATTEQHKIPVTILSRCLRFDFSKISENDIVKRVEYVLNLENVKYEKEAVEYIAKLADGGLRDALSIVERCISEVSDILTKKMVEEIIGAIDTDIINNIVKNINKFDSISAVENVDKVIKNGKDLRQLAYQINEVFLEDLINKELTNEEKSRYVIIIDRLSKLDNDLRLTARPEIVFKSCLIELTSGVTSNIVIEENISPNNNLQFDGILKRLSIIEERLLKSNISNNAAGISNKTYEITNKNEEKNIEKFSNQNIKKIDNLEELKNSIIEKGKIKIYSALASADMYISGSMLVIITSNNFAYNILKSEESITLIKEVIDEKYNINSNIKVELNDKNESTISKVEKLFEENKVDYTKLD